MLSRKAWLLFASLFIALLTLYNTYTIHSIKSKSKIGYVRSAVLVEKFNKAIDVKKGFQKEIEEWDKNARTLQQEFIELKTLYEKERPKLDSRDRDKREKVLSNKEQEYFKYTQAIRDKAMKHEKEIMQPVFDEMNQCIEEFAEKRGYRVIFGTLEGGNLVYANDTMDLTDKILKELNHQ